MVIKDLLQHIPHDYKRIFTGPPSPNEPCESNCSRCQLERKSFELTSLVLTLRAEAERNIQISKGGSPLTSMAEDIHLGQLGEYQLEIADKISQIVGR